VWNGLPTTTRQALLANPDNPAGIHEIRVTNTWVQTKFYGSITVTNGICPTSPTNLPQWGEVGTIRFIVLPAAERKNSRYPHWMVVPILIGIEC
jgi:hypothetical protein